MVRLYIYVTNYILNINKKKKNRFLFSDHIVEEVKKETVVNFEKRNPSFFIYRLRRPFYPKISVPFRPITLDVFSTLSVARRKNFSTALSPIIPGLFYFCFDFFFFNFD